MQRHLLTSPHSCFKIQATASWGVGGRSKVSLLGSKIIDYPDPQEFPLYPHLLIPWENGGSQLSRDNSARWLVESFTASQSALLSHTEYVINSVHSKHNFVTRQMPMSSIVNDVDMEKETSEVHVSEHLTPYIAIITTWQNHWLYTPTRTNHKYNLFDVAAA